MANFFLKKWYHFATLYRCYGRVETLQKVPFYLNVNQCDRMFEKNSQFFQTVAQKVTTEVVA